jgi:hypothetical protein
MVMGLNLKEEGLGPSVACFERKQNQAPFYKGKAEHAMEKLGIVCQMCVGQWSKHHGVVLAIL